VVYQIYTVSNYEETLKHEIAHCFSAFGKGLLNQPIIFNPSLIEGASAADPLLMKTM
jgi:hypothetical protein